MNRITTNQDGVVIATQGNISVEINGQTQLLAQGQSIPQGSILEFEDNVDFQLELADGSIQSQPTDSSQEIDDAAFSEIEALQDIIASGEDPTEKLPETAAGGPQGNQGGSDFTTLERSADETLANTAFDTQGLAAAILEQDEQTTLTSEFDSQLANDSNTITEDSVATGNVLNNDTDSDTTLSVLSYNINGQTVAAENSFDIQGGTLVINSDGSYSFTPAANWNGTLPTITYTTNTGATAELAINVTPVADQAVITPISSGSDLGQVEEDGILTTQGQLTVVDPDAGEAIFVTQNNTADLYGNFSIDESGNWNYVLDNNLPEIQALADGETLTRTFTVQSVDGTEHTITVIITGTDDAPIISTDSGNATEGNQTPVTGTLTATDADNPALVFNAQSYTDDYGTLTLQADGQWSYVLKDNPTVDALTEGQEESRAYTVSLSDGSTTTVTITITGTDNAPNISADSGHATEGDQTPVTGKLTASDADNPDLVFDATSYDDAYGTLTLQADGQWRYVLKDNPTVDALTEGQEESRAYTVSLSDGSTTTVTITITGTDNAPNISADSGHATEGDQTPVTGKLTASDADNPDLVFDATSYDDAYGTLTLQADGQWRYVLKDNPTVDALTEGQEESRAYTVSLSDGSTTTVTITITGTDNAPNISADSGHATEGDQTPVTGKLTASDADNPDLVFDATSYEDAYGTLTLQADGQWRYVLKDNPTVDALTEGQEESRAYTVSLSDGSTTTVTITITGTDNAPNISADSGDATEGDQTPVTGKLTASDADNPDLVFDATSYDDAYGTLTLQADGQWRYVLKDNPTVDALTEGQEESRAYTVSLSDGSTTTVTITITGTDNAPNISADSGHATEGDQTPVTGKLTASDADNPDLVFDATSYEDAYGTLTLQADGQWRYVLKDNPTVDALTEGQEESRAYTVTLSDGSTTTVTITITGTDNAPNISADAGSVLEGDQTPITGKLTASDADNPDLVFDATSYEDAYGTLTLQADGQWRYVLADNATVNALAEGQQVDSIYTVSLSDGSTTTVTIRITGTDDVSLVQNDIGTSVEDNDVTGNVLSNDSDVDNTLQVTSYSVNGQTIAAGTSINIEGGSLVINSDGSYSFNPAANWNGSLPTITYTTNTDTSAELNINVTPVDDPSVVQNDQQTVLEDQVATGNVLGNDSDADNSLEVVSFSTDGQTADAGNILGFFAGHIQINSDGSYTFTPFSNWNGVAPVITYTTNTGETAELTLTVTPVNDAPIGQDEFILVEEDSNYTSSVNLNVNDGDVDGDSISVVAGTFSTTAGGSITINADGSYSYQPPQNYSGDDSFEYTISDGELTSTATLTILVQPQDDQSVLQNDSGTSVEDSAVTGNVLSNDSDVDNTLQVTSYSVNGQTIAAGTSINIEGGSLVINSDGSYSFNPAANWNGSLPTITYTTNTDTSAELNINVTPVDDPSVVQNDQQTVLEDQVATGNVLGNDSDADNSLEVVSFSTDGQTADAGNILGFFAGHIQINSDGSYTFTPFSHWNGVAPVITYTTNTGETAELTLTVTPVNDAPIGQDEFILVEEDSNYTSSVNLNVNDGDVDGDSISVVAGTFSTTAGGSITINADGSYSYQPPQNYSGDDSFEYTISDGELTSTATLTILVQPQDDQSVLQNDSGTSVEDSAVTGNVLSNDSDVDNTLQVTSYSVNGQTIAAGTSINIEGGSLVINSDGSYSFNPAANWNGSLPTITYTTNTDTSAELNINVTPVDDPSVVQNDQQTVLEDQVATGNVLGNDSDADNSLEVVSFSTDGQTADAGNILGFFAGHIQINSDGSYTFTPFSHWNGVAPVITYTTNTGETAELTLTVTPVNDAPIGQDEFILVEEDSNYTSSVNLNVNDGDVDGDSISVVAGTFSTTAGGSITINADGSYSYQPPQNYSGDDSFEYTISDGELTSTATLTILVQPQDDQSVLQNDSGTSVEDSAVTGNVLSNDSDVDNTLQVTSYSVNGQTIAAGTSINIEGGSLVINSDGSYSFNPAANWNGSLPTITYTTNTDTSAELNINVTPVDDPSVVQNDQQTVLEDQVATGNVLGNDSDADNSLEVVSFSTDGQTADAGNILGFFAGHIQINSDGSYTFTPFSNWNGVAPVITYTTNTGETAELTLTVTPVNDAPIGQDEFILVEEDSNYTSSVNLNVNDGDVDGDSISVVAGTFSTTAGGSITINADGSYSYQPPQNYSGNDSFEYTISDGELTSTATLTIYVQESEDPTPPTALTVEIIDDSNNDGTLTQAEMGDNGVQVRVTVDHDELLSGGHVNISVSLNPLDGSIVSTTYKAVLNQQGNIIVTDENDNVVDGFSYDAATGELTWSEPKPSEGDSLSVKADQVDSSDNHSDPVTDTAKVEIVAAEPILELNSNNLLGSLDFEGIITGRFTQNITAAQLSELFVGDWGTTNDSGRFEIGTASTYLNASAANGHGYVLELENYAGDNSLYLDLELTAGRIYSFDFEAAARTHSTASNSNFKVVFEQLDDDGNPTGELWSRSVNFTSTNEWQQILETITVEDSGKYRISFEANNANSLGALLDNISFSEQINEGYEDNFIKISEINAALTAADEMPIVTLSNLPAGSVVKGLLSDGSGAATLEVGADGTLVIPSSWDYTSLQVQVSETGIYDIVVTATSTESDGSEASSSTSFDLVVHPQGYQPVDPVANTANVITTLAEGATIDIPEAWLLHSDVAPLGTQLVGASGAEVTNDTLSLTAEGDSTFNYTISTLGRSSSELVDVDLVTNNGSINGDQHNNIMIADATGGGVQFSAERGNDVVVGSDSGDSLNGNGGEDLLIGGAGNDHIDGGHGSDVVIGGAGDDRLTGGGGNDQESDTFVWHANETGSDRVTDFNADVDKLDLSDLLIDENMDNIEDYLSVNVNGDDVIIDVYAVGDKTGTVDQQIVLEDLGLSETEAWEMLKGSNGDGALIIDNEQPTTHSASSNQNFDDELGINNPDINIP